MVAEDEPNSPCNLFVPSASTGGIPARSSAGIVIMPPPPAIESIMPATKAALINMIVRVSKNSSMKGIRRAFGHHRLERLIRPDAVLLLDVFYWRDFIRLRCFGVGAKMIRAYQTGLGYRWAKAFLNALQHS